MCSYRKRRTRLTQIEHRSSFWLIRCNSPPVGVSKRLLQTRNSKLTIPNSKHFGREKELAPSVTKFSKLVFQASHRKVCGCFNFEWFQTISIHNFRSLQKKLWREVTCRCSHMRSVTLIVHESAGISICFSMHWDSNLGGITKLGVNELIHEIENFHLQQNALNSSLEFRDPGWPDQAARNFRGDRKKTPKNQIKKTFNESNFPEIRRLKGFVLDCFVQEATS